MRRGPRVVRMLEHVAAAIDARALAVPHTEDAVVLRTRIEIDLLRPPQRGRREIFVDPRMEFDVMRVEELRRLPQSLVERPERTAAIAGHVARGVQSRELIALVLQDQQPDQRLCSSEEDAALVERVFVVEVDGLQRGQREWSVHLERGSGSARLRVSVRDDCSRQKPRRAHWFAHDTIRRNVAAGAMAQRSAACDVPCVSFPRPQRAVIDRRRPAS